MRGGLVLSGRLLLLVGSILLLGAASVTIILVHNRMHRPHVAPSSRIRQVAGLIDLAAEPRAPPRDLFLRMANGSDMSAATLAAPPSLAGLHQHRH